MSIFSKLKNALSKTKIVLGASAEENDDNIKKDSLITIDSEFYDDLEEKLIRADLGFDLAEQINSYLKSNIKETEVNQKEINSKIKEAIQSIVSPTSNNNIEADDSTLILIVGVNGSGKTTSIGKLANKFKSENKKVLIAAGDTFRAAGAEQAALWAEKVAVDVHFPEEVKKADAVIYGAIEKAKSESYNCVLIDTAGRLQAQTNLMEELKKVDTVIEKNKGDYKVEKLIVLDATIGQNAIVQAKEFSKVVPLTGIILSKLDSSAKGGVVLNIMNELNLPVKFVGTGEQIEDIVSFNYDEYLNGLIN